MEGMMRKFFRNLLVHNTIIRAARVLDRRDRRRVLLVVFLQISFGLLDLAGVAIVGVLGALAVSGVQGQVPGNRVSGLLELVNLDQLSLQSQVAILGGCAATLLISKTVFSVIFTRKIMFFLSRRAAVISGNLISKILNQNLLQIQKRSSQETLYFVTAGVGTITLGILGTTVSLISDVSLLLVLSIGLFLVDPTTAIFTMFTFLVIGLILYRLLHTRALRLGAISSELSISSNEKILEVLSAYRESVVRNRRNFYSREIGKQRLALANTVAELTFMPNISKYVIEITVVLGMLGIGATQFLLQDVGRAVGVLSVFLAASTRIAPAVLRVQQGAIQIKGSLGAAGPTLSLIEELRLEEQTSRAVDELDTTHLGFEPVIALSKVSFKYSVSSELVLNNLDLAIKNGESVAIVGPSGAGKTTLVDVLLGVLEPENGDVAISGKSPSETIRTWPGAISYVPQDVLITNGTIRENVAMGFPSESVSDEAIWQALAIAQLDDVVNELEFGLDTHVGDRGTRLSGGQRQRLGIARAMYTAPKLLVLDEATSSLDGQTESDLAEAIHNLKGKVTVVMIAHRLSSVRKVDRVIYLENGAVRSSGTFQQVRSEVPNFDEQANLMGL
jgi:ABC-type multidrug transport system fused ATPase/permease subunit